MPYMPSEAKLWFYNVFKAEVENDELLLNNAEDWTRLRVWDGTSLKPVMPEGFSGMPTEEQMEMLYAHVKNKELFLYELKKESFSLLTGNGRLKVSKTPVEKPQKPRMFEKPANNSEEKKNEVALYHYNNEMAVWEAQEKHGAPLRSAMEGYYAGRNAEQDKKETAFRWEINKLRNYQMIRNRGDRIITQMMGPRPSATEEIFYTQANLSTSATLRYEIYNDLLKPNGYDLPQNDKLDEYDAATINFAMLGVASEMEKLIFSRGGCGPMYAKSKSLDGFNMLTTALFGYSRINQPLAANMGEAMKLGKESIDAYLADDPTLLGQRLGECAKNLKNLFTGAAQSKVTESLVAATKITERILNLFEKNPELWKASGLSDHDREYLRGYVQVGKIYDQYAVNQIKFTEAQIKGTGLSAEERAQILADALIRRMVTKEMAADSQAVENSKEYQTGMMEALMKDQEASQKLDQWMSENEDKYTEEELTQLKDVQEKLLDDGAHTVCYMGNYPVEHPIFHKLAQPGMLERLRENLMKDSFVLAQAQKEPFAFGPKDLEDGSKELDALLEQTMEKMAWIDNLLSSDIQLNSLRMFGKDDKGNRTLTNVVDPEELENPSKETLDMLYEHAKTGSLYFYNKDSAARNRLVVDGVQLSVQQVEQPERPTLWMRFANFITFGYAYAEAIEAAKDYAFLASAVMANEPAAQAEAPQEQAAEAQQEQAEVHQELQRQSAQAERDVAPREKTFVEQFYDRLAIPEKDLPVNSPIKLDGVTAGALRALAFGSEDLVIGQENDLLYNNPESAYQVIVGQHFMHKGHINSVYKSFVKKAYADVMDALKPAETGDYSKLAKLIADGLTQNNKMLQGQKEIGDDYAAYAALGGVALDLMADNSKLWQAVKNQLGDNSKQIDMAKAARNICNLRAEVMAIGQDLRAGNFPDAGDVAKVAQWVNIEVRMKVGQFRLEGSEYANDGMAALYANELQKSAALTNFLADPDFLDNLADPAKMVQLYKDAVADLQKQTAQQNGPEPEKQLENQPKEQAKEGMMA